MVVPGFFSSHIFDVCTCGCFLFIAVGVFSELLYVSNVYRPFVGIVFSNGRRSICLSRSISLPGICRHQTTQPKKTRELTGTVYFSFSLPRQLQQRPQTNTRIPRPTQLLVTSSSRKSSSLTQAAHKTHLTWFKS